MNSKTILITGGTGLIGRVITRQLLERGYKIIILTRNHSALKQAAIHVNLTYAGWDIKNQRIDKDAVLRADHIIHLAGAGVADKRWSKKRKQEIVDSRVKSSSLLVKTLKENENKVKSVISASAIGWYGPDISSLQKEKGFSETDPPSADFLGSTSKRWEESVEPVTHLGKRLVKFRTGIVLSNEGGAFPAFSRPVRFGIVPLLGSGRQIISWIHIDDLAAMYINAIENEKISGTYNAVSPRPVSNKELMTTIARQMKGKFYFTIPVPSFALKLLMGEMSIEVLKSATVSCEKIRSEGFVFRYPSIAEAIKNLCTSR